MRVEGTTWIAWIAGMARASPSTPEQKSPATLSGSLPTVRLEMRHGSAKSTTYEITDLGFLVGSVPGCDLRLPGVNLPPVLCLISRHAGGAVLRKLAPLVPILVNGQSSSSAVLREGDRITLGAIDLKVHVGGAISLGPSQAGPIQPQQTSLKDVNGRLSEREAVLKAQAEELETDRAIWYRRRNQLEQECKQMSESAAQMARKLHQGERDLSLARADVTEREQELRTVREQVEKQHEEFSNRAGELTTQQEELATTRRELADLRQQLYDRYRERRDRLAGIQEAVRKAARKVQERKRALDVDVTRFESEKQDDEARTAKLNEWETSLANERRLLDEQKQLLDVRQKQLHQELAERLSELQEREQAVLEERKNLERSQDEHQTDLVRLDRLQAVMERRQKQLQVHAREVDLRFEQLHRDSRELEDQAAELDALRSKVVADAEEIGLLKDEQEKTGGQLNQRASALEGQQAMLATLRTKLERMREEVRQAEGRVAEQQTRHTDMEAEVQSRLEAAEKLRAEMAADKELHDRHLQHFKERQAILEQAVTQLRQVQHALSDDEARLRQRDEELDAKAADQAEQAALVKARAEQLDEQQKRLADDRKALRDREASLAKSEQALAALQEHLRKRSEDLAGRHKGHEEIIRLHEESTAAIRKREEELQDKQRLVEEGVAAQQRELETQVVELARQRADLTEREEALRANASKVVETSGQTNEEKQKLAEERERWQEDQRLVAEDLTRQRVELEAARNETQALQEQLPALQQAATAALEKLNHSRANIREHLAEIHGFAQQSRSDLESLRSLVLKDADQVRLQERALNQARDEHRLAVAAFRQQLVDWQSQVSELKHALARDETRLERRQAEVDEQARQIDTTSQRLAQQAGQLEEQQRVVAERREEMERHLLDMREWYRHKLRELAGVSNRAPSGPTLAHEPSIDQEPMDGTSASGIQDRDILSLTGDVDLGDRQLGDLLTSLQLIDGETLTALLVEARRQRRSLRQLLLAGSYMTLYQLALIESGNLDGLALGPLRVIDRVYAGSKEVVYRVFDPRSNQEAMLRHLSEFATRDPEHAREFRDRFQRAASVRHPSLAAIWEVLDIGGRPAVLQESVAGLPSAEWPALTAAPGVWYRLLSQAALGLQAAHEAGLLHGHLDSGHVILTEDGIVKLSGFGEPSWLVNPTSSPDGASAQDDLRSLGTLASNWSSADGESKRFRAKPLPAELQAILNRLTASDEQSSYSDAAALLADLNSAGASVPANSTAWERFLKQVGEQSTSAKPALRRSA